MHPLQNCKVHKFVAPIDANGTTATDTEVDTLGYDYLFVLIGVGNIAADTDVLTINESDTASQTGDVIVTFTDLLATGGDGTQVGAFIDLRGRKRYISLVLDVGAAATLICAYGLLYRSNESPNTATERGLAEQFII